MKRKNELLIYGFRAVMALWRSRPHSIIKVYATSKRVPELRTFLAWCANKKIAYQMVEPSELEKITASVHHEEVAVLSQLPKAISEPAFLKNLPKKAPLIFVDGVSNHHNLGAMMRTMAHFGAPYLLGANEELPQLSASWVRLSEGGSEHVQIIRTRNKTSFLSALKLKGWTLIGLSSEGSASLYEIKAPPKCVFILGHEANGISKEVRKLLSATWSIPGTGNVQSLNVGVAAALSLGEWYRTNMGQRK